MKLRVICLAVIFSGLFVSSVYADYLQGHIVRIDRENSEIFIVLSEECPGQDNCHSEEEQQNQLDDTTEKTAVRVIAAWLPRCLSEGMMVYVRGNYSSDDHLVFKAVDVFPRKRRGGKDKTGVRSRFHHGRCSSW
jgi:hypothetical protein